MATSTDDTEADGNSGKYKVEIIWRRGTRSTRRKRNEKKKKFKICRGTKATRFIALGRGMSYTAQFFDGVFDGTLKCLISMFSLLIWKADGTRLAYSQENQPEEEIDIFYNELDAKGLIVHGDGSEEKIDTLLMLWREEESSWLNCIAMTKRIAEPDGSNDDYVDVLGDGIYTVIYTENFGNAKNLERICSAFVNVFSLVTGLSGAEIGATQELLLPVSDEDKISR